MCIGQLSCYCNWDVPKHNNVNKIITAIFISANFSKTSVFILLISATVYIWLLNKSAVSLYVSNNFTGQCTH